MWFYPLSCYFLLLRFKYFPQPIAFKHPQSMIILRMRDQVSHLYKTMFYTIAAIYLFQDVSLLTITQPNSIHMLWLIPQYFVMTMGEVMFSITGLEFSFTQVSILHGCCCKKNGCRVVRNIYVHTYIQYIHIYHSTIVGVIYD
jgi:hypothetical protein